MIDAAWTYGDGGSKHSLKEGMNVSLIFSTIVYGKNIIPGCKGVVVNPRVPKVTRKKGTGPFFALCDMQVDGSTVQIRVPHCALSIEK